MINKISDFKDIQKLLGPETSLLEYRCRGISAESLELPGPDIVDRVWTQSDRNLRSLVNFQKLLSHGDLANSGYISILPVDQGIEHSAGASFSPNPEFFNPEAIVRLALEAGCNAVTSSYGVLSSVARKYAHKIPFILKLNHNEFLSYPNTYDQIFFTQVEAAYDMGAAGVGATVYFGSPESKRQIQEVSAAFRRAHELGLFTVLWCYTRNPAFKKDDKDYHLSADLSSQANHLGVSLGADIIKQKMPENNGGYLALKYGKTDDRVYSQLAPDHPIEWVRYQVANCFMGRVGLINSGGASGKNDLLDAVKTAVINKRAGGMGLICGRKAFQKPFADGVNLLRAISAVYRSKEVTIA
jgi:class I fructose-bisphosphate aldolase